MAKKQVLALEGLRPAGEATPLISQGAPLLGRRDAATCPQRPGKVGSEGRVFVTDDWDGYHRCIPEKQNFIGKDLTFEIEQDNRNIRQYLARFRRRSKISSRSRDMVDLSLRRLHQLREPKNFSCYQRVA